MREPILFGWSGGKDSSLGLQAVLKNPALEVRALLTTVTDEYDRISMHGVRCSLLEQQAEALGLPLEKIGIPPHCSNELYEQKMEAAMLKHKAAGVRRMAFGDLFLEDIRAYRDKNLAKVGMEAIYPVWGKNTTALAREFIRDGFKTILVCIDPKQINPSFCGRDFDEALLNDLPATCDPCGENGEFHTFVYDGPIFKKPVGVSKGEIVERDGFWFCDLLPNSRESTARSDRGPARSF